MGEAATELDRYLADAPQEVKDEYQRRLNEAAEEAAKPYKELQDAIFGLADEYSSRGLTRTQDMFEFAGQLDRAFPGWKQRDPVQFSRKDQAKLAIFRRYYEINEPHERV